MPARAGKLGGGRAQEARREGGGKPAQEFEFCGPTLGPACLVLGLPAVCYGLVAACNSEACFELTAPRWPALPSGTRLFTREATLGVLLWFLGQVLLHALLPGRYAQGVVLRDGTRLTYKLTGFGNFAVTTAVALYLGFYRDVVDLGWIHDNFTPLLSAAVLLSCVLACLSYLSSFAQGTLLAAGGNTGHWLYDFFMGRPLNPRLGELDVKHFCELYPGLLGWGLINLGMVHKEWKGRGSVSAAMALVAACQGLYIGDALWHERAILTTMDITTDGFGFMLAFGDLAWVPFTYSLQTRYLAARPQALPAWAVAGVLALQALGYLVFRGSNSQKNAFREDPSSAAARRLRTLPTASGRRLIVSGWWGIARHVNYLGDWLMGWAWCLPCGFQHSVPYFYVAYFGALLVHRDLRDERACAKKYGRDWDRYCALVKWRIVPFLY